MTVTKATRDVIDIATRPVTNAQITGGNIDGTPIGATTASTGVFTNLSSSGTLTVTGNYNFSAGTLVGTLRATYADFAEKYRGDVAYAPGTVIKIGGNNEITATNNVKDDAYGIISSNPAIILNHHAEDDEYDVPVAIFGRVPCLVVGPIKKGERLVCSEHPGVAQAAHFFDNATRSPYTFAMSLEDSNATQIRLVEVVLKRG